jgi:hypothetical protein
MQRVRPGAGYPSLQARLAAQLAFRDRHAKRDALAAELQASGARRVVIAGGPRRGKSIVAEKLVAPGVTHHHGEELKDRPEWAGLTREEKWSAGSLLASQWLDEPGPYVCENVAMARALRKWLARNPMGKPADLVVHLTGPVIETSGGQEAMATGCETVWKEIRSELVMRGVRVIES